jgi:hypothetical protein
MYTQPKYYFYTLGIALLTLTQLQATEVELPDTQLVASLYQRKSKTPPPAAEPYEYQKRGEHGVFAYAEYLLWQVAQDGLQYTGHQKVKADTSGSLVNLKGNISSEKLSSKDIHPDYSSGVRLGLGYLLSKKQDGWDVSLEWTGYQGKSHGEVHSAGTLTDFLIPTWGNQFAVSTAISSGIFKKASANWHVNYQTLNLELGRNTFLSRKFSIRPYVGVQWALIQQEYKAKYRAPETISTDVVGGSTIAAFTTRFKGENDFQGTGLRFGADTKWYFSSHFGLCGEVAGALLWGRFHVRERFRVPEVTQTNNSLPNPTTTVIPSFTAKQKENLTRLRPNLQGKAGLFWQNSMKQGKQSIFIALEYEFIAWFFQNNLAPITASANGNTARAAVLGSVRSGQRDTLLSLQGLTTSIRYDF